MLNLNKIAWVCLAMLGLNGALYAAGAATGAGPAPAPAGDSAVTPTRFYLSVNEAYGRPFMSPGFSGSKDYGLSTSASFEYRGWDWVSLGAVYDHLAIIIDPSVLILDEVDLMGRITPFGRARMEPYLLVKAGLGLSYKNLSGTSGSGYHFGLGFGAIYSLTQAFAFDLGLSYQSNGLIDSNLNYIYAHLGFQYRFGAPAPGTGAPAPGTGALVPTPVGAYSSPEK